MRSYKIQLKKAVLEKIFYSNLSACIFNDLKLNLKGTLDFPQELKKNEFMNFWVLIGRVFIKKDIVKKNLELNMENFKNYIFTINSENNFEKFIKIHSNSLETLSEKINQKNKKKYNISRIEQAEIYEKIINIIEEKNMIKTKTLDSLKIPSKKRSILQSIIKHKQNILRNENLKDDINNLNEKKVYDLLKNKKSW